MALPSSKTAICNLALALIKEPAVSNIETGDSTIEALCNLWYDTIRTALMEAHNFSFCTTSDAILRGGTPSVSIYPDYYVLPNEYLKLTAIADPRTSLQKYDYSIQAGQLLIDNDNDDTLDIWYIFDQTDVATFPSVFINLLAGELALTLTYRVTAKAGLRKEVKEFTDYWRLKALAFNGQERPPRKYERSALVDTGLFPGTTQQVAGDHVFDFDF